MVPMNKITELQIPVCQSELEKARKTIRDAFEADEHFKYGYVSNVAMLLHDRYGITDHKKRNDAAKEILELIFY